MVTFCGTVAEVIWLAHTLRGGPQATGGEVIMARHDLQSSGMYVALPRAHTTNLAIEGDGWDEFGGMVANAAQVIAGFICAGIVVSHVCRVRVESAVVMLRGAQQGLL